MTVRPRSPLSFAPGHGSLYPFSPSIITENLLKHVNWMTTFLRTNPRSRDKRRGSRSGSQTHFFGVPHFRSFVRTFVYLPVGYKLPIFLLSPPPNNPPRISVLTDSTFGNVTPARPPLPKWVALCDHKPKHQYSQYRSTCGWVSRPPFCRVRSRLCRGFRCFAGASTGKFAYLRLRSTPQLDCAS